MSTGTVKFFNNAKWFGFIRNNDTGEEVFVHITGLTTNEEGKAIEIAEGDVVTYEVQEGKKGLNATNVAFAPKE